MEWPDFEWFKAKYGKKYSAEEETMRKKVYEHHVDELDIYEGEKYEVGINHMFDLTEEELNKMTGYHPNQKKSKKTSSYKPQRKGSTIPETLNWKD